MTWIIVKRNDDRITKVHVYEVTLIDQTDMMIKISNEDAAIFQ